MTTPNVYTVYKHYRIEGGKSIRLQVPATHFQRVTPELVFAVE
jgi:hypothetical protein